MKIFSDNRSSYFDIEVVSVEMMFPSLHLDVEVNDAGFAGLNGEVRVDADSLKKFVADIQTCERTRSGAAHLVSLSPDDLELGIENSDSWGHFILRYKIGKTSYSSIGMHSKMVAGEFDLDSSLFRQIVAEFTELLPT